MPNIKEMLTKDGRRFYKIRVSRGREKGYLSTRWYPPEGWSRKAIERELAKQAAEFERKAQAGEVISREEQARIDRQQAIEAAKIKTFRQYGEGVFMPTKAVTMSENGRSTYQGILDRWIYPALGELKLPEITPAEISALLLSMQAAGKAQATCVKAYTVLKSLFKMAHLADLIDRNPMDKVERPKPRKDEMKKPAEAESYTAGELKYILDCLEHEPLKWRAYMSLLIDTGLRRGEACGLKWECVDLDAGKLTIAGNLCYTPAKGVYMDTPKSGKTRTVDIAPGVAVLLRELRQEQAAKGLSHFVFNRDGSPEPMHPQTPTRYMKKFAQRYGIEGLHPHKLRHSFASVAITNGADVASVSEKLGHSDKAVTLRMYTHADEESIKRAGDIFQSALEAAENGK
ncbi:tyrosine-type recombinase/integrase [Acutalibacter intestini]|uniref:tyrosine-type recombinase/integrase n=1 Tax=Acutalibacter intestini TaxID=3093659 RepID=UPI002AC8B00B|nr:tyrosine-type recombinase/integrase [Acutalibacter sp. M00204]